jgi:hypothetical protein
MTRTLDITKAIILPGPPRDVHEVRNAFRGGRRGCKACATRTGALHMPYIRAGHRVKRTDEGKSQGLSLVDSTVRHAHCIKYYYNIEFQILYAYMLLID